MTWTAITKPAQGDATKKTGFADAVIDDLTHLYNVSGGAGSGAGGILMNGSFENDVDSDGIPDGWTQTLGTGASAAFDTTTPAHGAKAYKFTTLGSTDNYIESTDYIVCAVPRPVLVGFLTKSSDAGVRADVVIRWYNKDKSYLSSTTVYSDGTASPTAWNFFLVGADPPASSCFMKLRLYGGTSGDATAGDVYFDGVYVTERSHEEETMEALIASEKTGVGSYSDDASTTLYIPYGAQMIETHGRLKAGGTGGGFTASCRWRISTEYSDEKSMTSDTYVAVQNRIDVSSFQGTYVTIYLQIYTNSGTGAYTMDYASIY